MKQNRLYLTLALVFYAIGGAFYQAMAQNGPPQQTVSGTVTDALGPITGVNVILHNQNNGTFTDQKGQYSLMASPTDTLVFTYLGYKTVELPVGNRTQIDVRLQEEATALQEVEVNAGYYTVKERERTGSISRITSKSIETQPVANTLAVMQGQMSGVYIQQSTGVPGGVFKINIRGVNSLRTNGNEPLYIVDGVPFSSASLGSTSLSGGILAGSINPIGSLNPADIANIEVLKDADATAIYGSRGANGVVLITTKKGISGKTRFSINTYTSAGRPTRLPKMMDTEQYLSMRREAFKNDDRQPGPSDYDVNGVWDENNYTDWQKELLGNTAWVNNTQASLSGGNTATNFLISGTYRRETTVFRDDSNYNKANIHSNLNHRSEDDRFNFNLSVDYALDNNNLAATDLIKQAISLPPNAPALYDDKGNLNWENNTFTNPLAELKARYEADTKGLIANNSLSYKLLPSLKVKLNMGYTNHQVKEYRSRPSTVYNPAFGISSENSILLLNNGTRKSWIIEPQVEWELENGPHQIKTLIGGTFQSQKSEILTQLAMGFSSNKLIKSLGAAQSVTVIGEDRSEYKYQAVFARLNYTFDKQYIINLTGRRDGSSRFGPGKQFANFGAIGLAWLFFNEKWFTDSKWLSYGKFRASYGTTGNDQIGDYQYLNSYSISGNLYDGTSGISPSRLYNPDFGWETNKKLEVATELGLFGDKIFLTTAWYRNRSADQLVGLPLPATTGFPSIQANQNATVENSGWEFDLRTVNFSYRSLKWSTSFNLSIPKNKLLEFEGLEGSTYSNTYIIGKPITIQKVYEFTGVDPNTGLYTFRDFDGDAQINDPNDRQNIADLSPKYFGGLANSISYKNWNLDFLFQFAKQQGRNYLYGLKVPGVMINMPKDVLDHWPENGRQATIQRYTTGTYPGALAAYFRYGDSNATISDASYVRLRNVNLSYDLPLKWTGVFSGKLYLQGQNLLTITSYKGADPEAQLGSYLPPLRQYAFGVQLTF